MKATNLYMYRKGDSLVFFQHQAAVYNAFVAAVKPDQTVRVTMRLDRPGKSNPQLAYYHGILLKYAKIGMIDAGHDTLFDVSVGDVKVGVKTTQQLMDTFFKTLYMHHSGKPSLPKKRDMSVDDMRQYIDFCIGWLAANLGVSVPPPRKDRENA